MKEYILHSTKINNLENILKDEFININPGKYNGILPDSHNQIFTQLIYKDIQKEKTQIPSWFNCCFVLDKKILKDYPFYATCIGCFKDNFNDVLNDAFNDAFMNENIYAIGKGNLKKIPNLKNLKEKINNYMINNYMIDRYKIVKSLTYIHSHEILFNKKISLIKYCKCIIYPGIIPDNIIKLASSLKIPIKSNITYKKTGLNNFIEFISEK